MITSSPPTHNTQHTQPTTQPTIDATEYTIIDNDTTNTHTNMKDIQPGDIQKYINKFYLNIDISPQPVSRFTDETDIPSQCHIWTGPTCSSGVPRFSIGGKYYPARVIAYRLHHFSAPPPQHQLRTICNNIKCVSPYHIKVMPRKSSRSQPQSLEEIIARLPQDIQYAIEVKEHLRSARSYQPPTMPSLASLGYPDPDPNPHSQDSLTKINGT